jgi:2-phospho-L-lactate guanylyltransferase
MKTLVVVPMKDLWSAKSRLAPRLDSMQRKRVALDLFNRGQRFLSQEFPELERLVVTPCPLVTRLALEYGTAVLPETSSSGQPNSVATHRGEAALNRAALLALTQARVTGCDWLLILPGDLPHLLVQEFQQLLSLREPRRATVVASRDGGTNALLLPVSALSREWSFDYGNASAERHATSLVQECLCVTRLNLPALAHDVDTVEDYAQLPSWWQDDGEGTLSRFDSNVDVEARVGVVHPVMQSGSQLLPRGRGRYA